MNRDAFFEAFYNLFSPEVHVTRDTQHAIFELPPVPDGFAALVDCHGDLIMLVPDEDGQPEKWAEVLNSLEDCYYGRLK